MIDISEDKKRRAVVQQTYKVRRPDDTMNYTLNLYPTKNTMLLNGKDIDRFMTDHLPVIHKIMCKAVRDEQLGSVENYNHILGTQLQEVLQQRENAMRTDSSQNRQSRTSVTSPKSPATNGQVTSNGATSKHTIESPIKRSTAKRKDSSPDNICPKCDRTLHFRGALCEVGNHWVHYHCDRLTESEIKRLHNEPGFIYVCKMCREREDNTLVKRPCSSLSPATPTKTKETNTIQLPAKSRSSPKAVTQAEAILAEESQEICQVCQTEIDDEPNRCSYCLARCHTECMLKGANGDICLSCGASQAQMELTDSQTPTPSTINAQCRQTTRSPSMVSPRVEETKLTDHSSSEQPHGLEVESPAVITKSSETQIGGEPQTAANNCQGVKLKTKDKKTSSDTQAVKYRELRQMEAKLKKREEELKLRETVLNDKEVDRRKLEDYLQRTEARNVEQEATIRTLYRKISLLE